MADSETRSMASLPDTLARLHLVEDAAAVALLAGPAPHGPGSLLRLCEAGLLQGGLSVALGVRPDELVGPLTLAMGGAARRLKVVDVRERPALELHIQAGALSERWEVEDVPALVHNLNSLYQPEPQVRAVAVLGEWEDALQLWCLDKQVLPRLWRLPFFAPLNRADLAPRTERR